MCSSLFDWLEEWRNSKSFLSKTNFAFPSTSMTTAVTTSTLNIIRAGESSFIRTLFIRWCKCVKVLKLKKDLPLNIRIGDRLKKWIFLCRERLLYFEFIPIAVTANLANFKWRLPGILEQIFLLWGKQTLEIFE